jgi:hypothetical protein
MGHIDDHDLERYHLGMVIEELELARIEKHLLWCGDCVRRAKESADYVDLIRVGIIKRNWDISFTGDWTHSASMVGLQPPGKCRRGRPEGPFDNLRPTGHGRDIDASRELPPSLALRGARSPNSRPLPS